MPEGPRLPRKDTALKRSREALEGAAYQIGVLIAIQRNRAGWTQWDLAQDVGAEQIAISRIENGQPAPIPDDAIDSLFREIDLPTEGPHADFIKWWRDHGGT
jgi:ribosome-binding protein aMBF1 (putative translation factor)